jgi:ribosomal protein L21E
MIELKEKNPSYFKVLVDKFYHGKTGIHTQSVARALAKLTLRMNQIHNRMEYSYEDGIGTRQIFTNLNAWAITGEWG